MIKKRNQREKDSIQEKSLEISLSLEDWLPYHYVLSKNASNVESIAQLD